MKKVLLSLVVVLSFALLVGCGSKKADDPIVGTWEGATEDGLKTTFTFTNKSEVKYENEFGFTGEGTYEIKDDEITITIDLWTDAKVYKYEIKDDKLSLETTDMYSPSYKDMTRKK